MNGLTKPIFVKAAAVTGLAIVATYCIFFLTRWATGVPYMWLNLVECFIIPVAVGMPILCYIFTQSDRLRLALDTLAELNKTTEQAHQQLRQAHEVMAHAARHDHMTGLLNRKQFLEDLKAAHCDGEEGVLLMIDADRFKQINDFLGHLKGDEALVSIATAIRTSVRPGDVVGRVGGEEFAVLLRSVDLAEGAEIAEHIREQVERIPWEAANRLGLSVSIGVAALRDHPGNLPAVLGQADRCLYAAKHSGRNCVATNHELADVA